MVVGSSMPTVCAGLDVAGTVTIPVRGRHGQL
jgi:hypothetical protein